MMFGQSVLFGMPSDDVNINMGHLQQAQQYLQANPQNVQAQRQCAYWTDIVQRQQQAAASAAPVPPTAAPGAPPGMGQPTPSFVSPINLTGVQGPQAQAGFH